MRSGDTPLRITRRKTLAPLAYLACPAGKTYTRDALATLLWPDAAETAARTLAREIGMTVQW